MVTKILIDKYFKAIMYTICILYHIFYNWLELDFKQVFVDLYKSILTLESQ